MEIERIHMEINCWVCEKNCGYKCCQCQDTGIVGNDTPMENDCMCIDEGIWEE